MTTTTDDTAILHVCEQLVRRDVLCCCSVLVNHCMKHPESLIEEGYDEDALIALSVRRTDPDGWTVEECREWFRDRGLAVPEIDEDDEDEWQDAVRDADMDEPTEVYEHWIVSRWFANKLRKRGETVGELFDFTIWGRTTTGQAIYLDEIIREIAADMEILPGQRSAWST